MTWREHAQRVIQKLIAEARAAGLENRKLIAHIDAGYPYGERAHYPYQVWLEERNAALVELGLAKPNKRLRRLRDRQMHQRVMPTREEQLAAGQVEMTFERTS